MNDKNICIIIQKNTEENTRKCNEYLQYLKIPYGFTVDIMIVDKKQYQMQALQYAMKNSCAKYKIYLEDDHIIVDKNVLINMINLFTANDKIGIIGALGTTQLLTDVSMAAELLYGSKLYMNGQKIIGNEIENDFQEVMAIQAGFLATQYDIDLRTDIFDYADYYAESQCIEFKRNGYMTVVPNWENFWLLANNFNTKVPKEETDKFLDEYSKDIYPLVSVVIPTYKRPKYFQIALDSVVKQTYRNLDIFITDDSPDNETEELMKKYYANDDRICYEHHPEYNRDDNWSRVINYNNKAAEYVNYLMDDDYFAYDKIAKMINYFFICKNITLVTSYRKCVDTNGAILPDLQTTQCVTQNTSRFDGESVGRIILTKMANFIGEPTTPLIKKQALKDNKLGWTGKEKNYFVEDFPTWLQLMTKGDLIYITEPLSYFRWHEENGQNDSSWLMLSHICWAVQIAEAIDRNIFLINDEDKRKAICTWFSQVSTIIPNVDIKNKQIKHVDVLLKTFEEMAAALLNDYKINLTL